VGERFTPGRMGGTGVEGSEVRAQCPRGSGMFASGSFHFKKKASQGGTRRGKRKRRPQGQDWGKQGADHAMGGGWGGGRSKIEGKGGPEAKSHHRKKEGGLR